MRFRPQVPRTPPSFPDASRGRGWFSRRLPGGAKTSSNFWEGNKTCAETRARGGFPCEQELTTPYLVPSRPICQTSAGGGSAWKSAWAERGFHGPRPTPGGTAGRGGGCPLRSRHLAHDAGHLRSHTRQHRPASDHPATARGGGARPGHGSRPGGLRRTVRRRLPRLNLSASHPRRRSRPSRRDACSCPPRGARAAASGSPRARPPPSRGP